MTSIWSGDGGTTVNADNTYKAQRFTATAGQTIFTLTQFVYTPGTNSLLVYVSGADNFLGVHYAETNSTTVTFLSPLEEGDDVVIRGLVGSVATDTAAQSAAASASSAAAALQAYEDTLALTPSSLPLPIDKGGSGQTTQVSAFNALSPSTTKGDIIINNGTNNVRLAIGADGLFFVADPTAPEGAKWANKLASKAEMQAAAAADRIVPVDLAQHHPGAAKAWAYCDGGTGALITGYNIASTVLNGTGDLTINYTTSFVGSHVPIPSVSAGTVPMATHINTITTSSARILNYNTTTGVLAAPIAFLLSSFGTQ